MSEINPAAPRKSRPPIVIEGETWKPRDDFAADDLHVNPKTVQRMNLRTLYVGNVAHVPVEESLREIAARARRRQEPAKRRHRR